MQVVVVRGKLKYPGPERPKRTHQGSSRRFADVSQSPVHSGHAILFLIDDSTQTRGKILETWGWHIPSQAVHLPASDHGSIQRKNGEMGTNSGDRLHPCALADHQARKVPFERRPRRDRIEDHILV